MTERRSDEELHGHWSNFEPVHLIIDGEGGRRIAPNLHGGVWVPDDCAGEHEESGTP
ncbi:MAG: hypothetical protein ABWY57_15915 [Mycetocola sp.]